MLWVFIGGVIVAAVVASVALVGAVVVAVVGLHSAASQSAHRKRWVRTLPQRRVDVESGGDALCRIAECASKAVEMHSAASQSARRKRWRCTPRMTLVAPHLLCC